jgi:protein gp37
MSPIERTDRTWNLIPGCWPVSAGCARCFATQSCATVHRTSLGTLPHGRIIHRIGGEVKWTGEVNRGVEPLRIVVLGQGRSDTHMPKSDVAPKPMPNVI